MNSRLNEQRWFETGLTLMGKVVEIGLLSTGKVISGRVANTMFDSFLLDQSGKPVVVRFSDINYLIPLPGKDKRAKS